MPERSQASWLDLLPVLLTAAALLGATLLGIELRRAAAPVAYAQPTVVDAATLPVVLGRDELGQHAGPRSAAQRHLRIDRAGERWIVANASQERRVFARTRSGKGFYLHRWPLQSGDRILLPGALLEVKITGSRITLRDVDSGRRAVFDGSLRVEGEALAQVCHSATRRLARRLRWWLRGLSGGDELRLFSIGGAVNCSSRWSLPGSLPESIRINWQHGVHHVAPGVGSDALFIRGGRAAVPFAAHTVPVDGDDPVTRLILGRTLYGVRTTAESLTLTPIANRDLWRDELPDLPMQSAAWAGVGLEPTAWASAQALWMLPGLTIALGILVGLRVRLGRRRDAALLSPLATSLAFAIAFFGLWVTLLTQRGEGADALLRYGMLIASLGYATAILGLRDRLFGIGGLLWATATGLALFGTVVLLLLGAGAENTQWMRFFDKHSLVLTLYGWSIAAFAALPTRDLRWGWMHLFDSEWIVAGAGLLLVALMAVQLSFGSEAGIGGIQPVELTKSVFVVLLGFAGMHLMEVRRRDTREYRRSPLTVLLPFLRIIGAFALVVLSIVVGVRDFSPGIILGLVALLWLFRVGRREEGRHEGLSRWGLLRALSVALLLCVAAAATFARLSPERLPVGMPQRDRILVWAEPELHPHSGSQVLSAMDRVGQGGWSGAREWFGPNEDAMQVPAVQDDFITAFFLNRFGGLAGLCLLCLQLIYVALLFALSRRLEAATRRADFWEQNAGRVLGFTLFGLAWMHTIHWGIAWGNTLGLLPVMGQPMTWMSAGNSHLLGFALLSLTIALACSWLLRDFEAER